MGGRLTITPQSRSTRVRWTYPGGKGAVGVYQSLINCMPPHETYIEAFLGGGAVLRHKRSAKRNIGIEIDADLIACWRQVNNPSLELIHGNALEILRGWSWRSDEAAQTLLYCDPPYLASTRRSDRPLYKHDLRSEDEHVKLLEILIDLPCMVMVSSYSCSLYESLIGHWRQVEFRSTNRAAQRTLETVWLNFPPPLMLHDYRYLGKSFRERERIKRRRERWKIRLSKLSALERQAVLCALDESTSVGELIS